VVCVRCCSLHSVECISRRSCPGLGRKHRCRDNLTHWLISTQVDCVADPSRSSNGGEPIWNVGGPDAGVSMKRQGELIADAIAAVDGGERKEPWLLPVPIGVFDGIVGAIKWVYDLTGADSVRDAWELGKIGRYYAVEDMLTTAEAERYGAMSLREHYENVAKNGQEYDPYTTVFAKNPLIK
jgi:divinyl chlorophyllide a 8-vinyl-reductase